MKGGFALKSFNGTITLPEGIASDSSYQQIPIKDMIYFAAIGGAGALYGNAVKKSECVAFPELLSEAVYRFEIENFPVVVAIDSRGNTIY